jgi:hypothetical protein
MCSIATGGSQDKRVEDVPGHGLTLMDIYYPDPGHLAERAEQTRAPRRLPAD